MCAFAALISKLQSCVHSMNTPLLLFPSLSASQLNEVNKLKSLLPSLTPSLLPCFLLHLPFFTSLLLSALLSQHSSTSLPLLSLPPSFISAEMLSSSFLHLFFIVIVARRKLWDFLPFFPGQSCNYSSGEKKTSCAGDLRAADRSRKKTKIRAPLRGEESKVLVFPPQ